MLGELRRCLHIEYDLLPGALVSSTQTTGSPCSPSIGASIAGEVAPKPSTASVVPTEEASETTTACGIRKTACRLISTAKKQQILDLARTGMAVSQVAAEVGVAETTVRATCRQAKQPPRPQATLYGRRPPACSAAPRPGAYLHRDRAGTRLRAGYGQEASGDSADAGSPLLRIEHIIR